MNEQIKAVIETYAQGGTAHDIDAVASVLSPDFRVVVNRFRGTAGTTIISREAYLGQLKEGNFGGTSYALDFIDIAVYAHTAQAEVWYRGEKSDMHHFFALVQNERDNWQLVSTMAVVVPK